MSSLLPQIRYPFNGCLRQEANELIPTTAIWLSVPGHALRCGPETSYKPLAVAMVRVEGAREDIYPVVEAVGMWEARRDFQRVWQGWEAGFTAFHAFHTLSFPWPAFRAANAGQTDMPPHSAMCRTRHEMLIGTHRLSLSALVTHVSGFAREEPV
jgi:hypothetical protein